MEQNSAFLEAKRRFDCGMNARVFFGSMSSIQSFVNDVLNEVGVDDVDADYDKKLYDVEIEVKYPSKSILHNKSSVQQLVEELPLTVIFDNLQSVKAFSMTFVGMPSVNELVAKEVKKGGVGNTDYPKVSIGQNEYSTNHGAEEVLDTASSIFRTIFTIIGIILIIAGIAVLVSDSGGIAAGVAVIVSGICVLILGYVVWASLKVIVNISNNLYSIRDTLKNK